MSSAACQPLLSGSWGQEEEECFHVCSVDRTHPVLQRALWLPLRTVEEAILPPSGSWLLHSEHLTPGACPGERVPEAVHSASLL